jgi:CubicO group peptidase (beta-lactamase class C family)
MNPLARSVLVVVVLMLVAGCSTKPARPAEPAPPPTARSQADVPPPLVPAMALPENAVDNAVAKLDGIAAELMKKSGIPGMAVAVVHGGKTVYAKGFGVRDVKTGDKVDPDTVFQLASLSKPLSATVVAHQVGERDRLGHADRVEAALVRAGRSGRHADGRCRRYVLAPVRAP